MGLWWVKVNFDNDFLTYNSISVGSYWDDPSLPNDPTQINSDGIFEAYAIKKSSISDASVTGTHVYLCDVTFTVK